MGTDPNRMTAASQYIKRSIGIDVLTAARQRIAYTFDNFEQVYVSYSGGKDSTVMLHLVMDEALARGRRVGVLFIDLEGQYRITIESVREMFERYRGHIDPYWVALPIHLRNAVSAFEPFWLCWDPAAILAWVRQPPPGAIVNEQYFPFFSRGMEFEEFVPEFGRWYAGGKSCACFVGIRTDESLNRFRTIARMAKEMHGDKHWTTRVVDSVYNVYPIYDWRVDDIWTYHARYPDKPYNRLYDLMHKAGLTPAQMRICQPYGDDQRRGLWLFHLIEPETWARVVARVNGANGGAMYVQESGNMTGYRKISKPDGHTWESFARLLVGSMPPKSREHYENKIAIFRKWWMDRGYSDGIPDEADYKMEAEKLVPSWRRVCKSLLRNDYWCKGLSFTQQRSDAYEAYLALMRRRREKWGL
jgi:predicted phosphoadenosine phosphosulfate sulfurtransferase